MILCQLIGGPADGRTVERPYPTAPAWTWVAHGPLGLIERYKCKSYDRARGAAEYTYDG